MLYSPTRREAGPRGCYRDGGWLLPLPRTLRPTSPRMALRSFWNMAISIQSFAAVTRSLLYRAHSAVLSEPSIRSMGREDVVGA